MRAEQSKFADTLKSSGDEATENHKPDKEKAESSSVDVQQEEPLPVCSLCHDPSSTQSPLCYLILLQVCFLMLDKYMQFYYINCSCMWKRTHYDLGHEKQFILATCQGSKGTCTR